MSQLTPKQQRAEMDWVRREKAKAEAMASLPIEDYARASVFSLEARIRQGDRQANEEMRRRKADSN